MQYLFVITYGRSGSTVLLNLLNAIDGYTIRGENSGVVNHLSRTVSLLAAVQKEPHAKAVNPSAPWYGILEPDVDTWGRRLAQAFEAEFLRPEPDTRVLGFKEIRYTIDEMSDTDYHDTIDFLARYFPGSRFIFNTRDWSEVAESGWWRYYPDVRRVRDIIRSGDRRFRASVETLGDRAFLIDYADFKGKPEGFRPLIDWLGAALSDEALARITEQKLRHMKLAQEDRGKVLRLRRKLSRWAAASALDVATARTPGP